MLSRLACESEVQQPLPPDWEQGDFVAPSGCGASPLHPMCQQRAEPEPCSLCAPPPCSHVQIAARGAQAAMWTSTFPPEPMLTPEDISDLTERQQESEELERLVEGERADLQEHLQRLAFPEFCPPFFAQQDPYIEQLDAMLQRAQEETTKQVRSGHRGGQGSVPALTHEPRRRSIRSWSGCVSSSLRHIPRKQRSKLRWARRCSSLGASLAAHRAPHARRLAAQLQAARDQLRLALRQAKAVNAQLKATMCAAGPPLRRSATPHSLPRRVRSPHGSEAGETDEFRLEQLRAQVADAEAQVEERHTCVCPVNALSAAPPPLTRAQQAPEHACARGRADA